MVIMLKILFPLIMMLGVLFVIPANAECCATGGNSSLGSAKPTEGFGRAEGPSGGYIPGCNCRITTYPYRPGVLRFSDRTKSYTITDISRLMGFTPRDQGSVRMSVARTTNITSSFMADKTKY
jgi:hypothetical protein